MLAEFRKSPTFEMACQQYDRVAGMLDLPQSERDRTRIPRRALIVAVPVRMDDGHTEIFSGYRVQHHLSVGPTKGGLRYHPDVTLGEVAALAMWMSWKVSLCGLPYGGAKGGVACDPRKLSAGELERLTRRYTQEMIPFIAPHVDVMAPDLGTNEQVMAWMMDTYSMHVGHPVPQIVTGKPVSLGGSAGRREATGRGVAFLVHRVLESLLNLKSESARVAIQGFGNVGSIAAQQLHRFGARIIAVTDQDGGLHNPNGLDVNALIDHVARHGDLRDAPGGDRITNAQLLELDCDVLIPAAIERQITGENVRKLRCRVLAEAANGPTTIEADAVLRDSGILVIPDVLCNAGGVIVSYFEWVQDLQSFFWSEAEVNDRLYRQLETAYHQVVQFAKKNSFYLRDAALALGITRIVQAKKMRGLFP